MKTIRQEDRSGCGIACVAMVTGRSYDEVRSLFVKQFPYDSSLCPPDFGLKAVGNCAGTTAAQLAWLLEQLGTNENVEVCKAPKSRIIAVKQEYGLHWIVVDEHGNRHDPQ
jgi:hypothetical protein